MSSLYNKQTLSLTLIFLLLLITLCTVAQAISTSAKLKNPAGKSAVRLKPTIPPVK